MVRRIRATNRHKPLLALAVLAVVYAAVNALLLQNLLAPLSPQDQTAMHRVSQNTNPASAFIILPLSVGTGSTDGLFWTDRASEWFPALAERHSAATVQGQEWVGDFDRAIQNYGALEKCEEKDVSCLETWSVSTGRPFDYVYFPWSGVNGADSCCHALRESLASNPHFIGCTMTAVPPSSLAHRAATAANFSIAPATDVRLWV